MVVLSLDFFEFLDVLLEVFVLGESDDELGLLLLAVLISFHGDGLSLDLNEVGVLISI